MPVYLPPLLAQHLSFIVLISHPCQRSAANREQRPAGRIHVCNVNSPQEHNLLAVPCCRPNENGQLRKRA